jgi:hypothetical protein
MPPYQVRGRLLRSGMTGKDIYKQTLIKRACGGDGQWEGSPPFVKEGGEGFFIGISLYFPAHSRERNQEFIPEDFMFGI